MKMSGLGTAAVLAMLASACSGDSAHAGTGTGGTGSGGAKTGDGGGTVSDGGEKDGGQEGGTASCEGTQSTDPMFSQAMQVLRDTMKDRGLPGAALAVVKDGEILGVGVAGSKTTGGCAGLETLFHAGFVASGFITALATLDAVEDGKLDLSAPITNYVPGLTVSNGNASDITLHTLLNGSSGYWAESLSTGSDATSCNGSLEDAYVKATNPVLYAKPGSVPREWYVNQELAGLALQNADGKPFVTAATDRVLGPLAMGGTYDEAAAEAGDFAGGAYGPFPACKNQEPAVGYSGSIRDVAKLYQYLTGGPGSLLTSETLDKALSRQGDGFYSNTYDTYMGMGATVGAGDDRVFGDGYDYGAAMGFRIYRQRRLALVVLANGVSTVPPLPTEVILDTVAQIYDPTLGPLPQFGEPYTPDPATLPSLVGTYQDDLGFKGTGPRTLTIALDPADPHRLAGTVTANGASDAVALAGSCCADNFTITLGANPMPATDPWREVRLYRDTDGNGSIFQINGDNGPPFFRVP